MPRLTIALLLLLAGAGCDSRSLINSAQHDAAPPDADPLAGLVSILVAPADQTLVIDGTTPATGTYTATGTFGDGQARDITAYVSFRLTDPGLGGFNGPALTSTTYRGGRTQVVAQGGTVEGVTGLTLVLRERGTDPSASGLPPDPSGLFGGPVDPARAPALVYPNDGTLVPPNLKRLEIHFLTGPGNTVFALDLQNGVTDVRVYLRCPLSEGGGCIYQPSAEVWRWIAETNRGGEALAITLRGTAEGGGSVGVSTPIALSFSQDDLLGAIYYWTTSNGTAIMRYDFASDMSAPERFIDGTVTDGSCVGCHSLSRDGKWIAATTQGGYDGRVLLYDVARTAPIVPFGQPGKSVFETWNPDGTQYAGVFAAAGAPSFDVMIFDGASGVELGALGTGGTATQPVNHPDWSPDGKHIAYVRLGTRWGTSGTLARFYEGQIEMVDEMGGTWSAPRVLVPRESLKNHYYPTFAPDGNTLLYNASACASALDATCNAYEDPGSRLVALALDRPGAPVDLAAANAPGLEDAGATDFISSFPKWSPFVFQRTRENGSPLEWLTFSSGRRYGLRATPPGGGENGIGTLVWMAAFDPGKLGAGVDPSSPAFALPFQDLTTSNHIAQWTTRIVPPVGIHR